ncbi:hypothetical protein BB427_13945 [Pseudoalteromonas sp. BMB]|uniref:hypothetical protein n=1 Tax=Pseudoalteromonas sp. BMB TaxID=1874619 RepID=UPI00083DB533|nr:hypothetical protein [Pseudoalteromonas sp. BMB]ODB37095.1 hypothetical protein BB427_13945 [Pseudoalteromonas sp. BMB]
MHAKHSPIKMVALKLCTLSWLDRIWLLKQLQPSVRLQVKVAYKEIKSLQLENPQELLEQFTKPANEGLSQDTKLPEEVASYLKRVDQEPNLVTPQVKAFLVNDLVSKNQNIAHFKEAQ